MSSLKKFQIINELNKKYGISIKSVQKLNKILEEMGILERWGSGWFTTAKGMLHSPYISQGVNADLWRESIVDAIAKFIKEK